MKNQITLLLACLISCFASSQEMAIETKSVDIQNLIPFVIETIDKSSERDSLSLKSMTFLIQTLANGLTIEDKVILKQAFKLVSKRLSEEDNISIIAYSGINGISLKKTSPKELKKIMHALENFKSSVKELHEDGITFAYEYAKENFEEDAINTVVMIRNPNTANSINTQTATVPKKRNNTVLITAIALLPEIISVIKD